MTSVTDTVVASGTGLAQLNPSHASIPYDALATRYLQQYWKITDSHVRLALFAGLSAGKSVLDVACGPGIMGHLASELVGGAENVYFTDRSMPMLKQAKIGTKSKYDGVEKSHFQRCDFRDPVARAELKERLGRPEGFDVVFAKLFINHFQHDSQAEMVAALMEMCAPGGVAVFDFGLPGPSRHIRGKPSDEMTLGWRRLTLHIMEWAEVSTTLTLPIVEFDSLITAREATLGERAIEDLVAAAGGRIVRWQESFDRSSAIERGEGLWTDPNRRIDHPNETPEVQADLRRRQFIDQKLTEQDRLARAHVYPVMGATWGFQVAYGLDMVVQKLQS